MLAWAFSNAVQKIAIGINTDNKPRHEMTGLKLEEIQRAAVEFH